MLKARCRDGVGPQCDLVKRNRCHVSRSPFCFCSLYQFANRVWISSQDAAAVAAKGFRIVHSPSDYFYLVTIEIPVWITCPSPYLITLNTFFRIVVRVNGLAMIPQRQRNLIPVMALP